MLAYVEVTLLLNKERADTENHQNVNSVDALRDVTHRKLFREPTFMTNAITHPMCSCLKHHIPKSLSIIPFVSFFHDAVKS